MFLSKKHISRRTVLRGAGTMLALPLLDAMIPAATALAQTAASAKPRFVGLFVPHGMAPGYWVPTTEGALGAELPFNWKPLEPWAKQTVIFSGLHSRSAERECRPLRIVVCGMNGSSGFQLNGSAAGRAPSASGTQ